MDAFPNKTGGGNASSPYIIENLEIDAGGVNSCIWIKDTTKPLIIRNCTLNNSGSGAFDSGIRLENCNSINITECNISDNSMGVYTFTSSSINISKNNISSNDIHGVWFSYSSTNKIIDNEINGNSGSGITLSLSNDNLITKNVVSFNAQNGIFIDTFCQYNDIYQNSISSNTVLEAKDDGSLNKWDNDVMGNYWGNYTASNPNATHDGFIWDTPYVIVGSANARDNYPVVNFLGSHSIIDIEGNTELIAFPDKTGGGTLISPYLIQDLIISSRGGHFCIKLKDINIPLMIENT
ncbi:MAG: NosD domain-containing protein [Candidatus Hodarchaeota archaeon]